MVAVAPARSRRAALPRWAPADAECVQTESGGYYAAERDARLAAGVHEGDTVAESLLAQLQSAAARFYAERQALALVARAPHTRCGLRIKLQQRGYDEEVVERCLARLEELGYLDDLEFARHWLRSRSESGVRRGQSSAALLAGLQQRGVPRETAAEALDVEIDDAYESRAAMEAARRTKRGASRGAVAAALYRRGFSQQAIHRALEQLTQIKQLDVAEDEHTDADD